MSEFLEKGFQATSMDALAARAGVSKRTVYNHFASKEALFQAIGHELLDISREMTRIPYDATRPLEEQLRTFWPQLLHDAPFPDEATRGRIVEDAVGMFLTHFVTPPSP